MSRFIAIACIGAGLVGCADNPEDELSRDTDATLHGSATVDITAEAGGSCERACFEVRSSKHIGFIAVDAASCDASPVEWSLFAIGESGAETPMSIAPEPHGKGKSCPLVPSGALKLDGLHGRHFKLCAAGARSVDVYAKSASTCTGATFEVPPPKLVLSASLDPQGCNLTTFHEVWSVTREDGTPLPFGTYTCEWSFDDGGTSQNCSGHYTFSAPGMHASSVTVTEIDTGATGTESLGPRPIWDVLTVDVVATAPACGLWFEYSLTKSGGKPTGGFNFYSVTPHETVVTPPEPGTSSGVVEVSAPGIYTIRGSREEETAFSLCHASDTAEVTVIACP